MSTQLTLITVPPVNTDVDVDPDDQVDPDDHVGWLDRTTIVTGRVGIARARAALADATRRVALEAARRDNARGAALAREADSLASRHERRGHAA